MRPNRPESGLGRKTYRPLRAAAFIPCLTLALAGLSTAAESGAVKAAGDSLRGALPAATAKVGARADSLHASPAPAKPAPAVRTEGAGSLPPATAKLAAPADSARADTAKTAPRDSAARADSAGAARPSGNAPDTLPAATARPQKRKTVVRETTVNPIDQQKGRYRSPKRALFMSLLVPGLGQAYVGHYARGAGYFLIDAAMGVGWYRYAVQKYDHQVKLYQRYADTAWSQARYENFVNGIADVNNRPLLEASSPHRDVYCGSVVDKGASPTLYNACVDPSSNLGEYNGFKAAFNDEGFTPAQVAALRSGFPDPQSFYELIGKEQEFLAGWNDAPAQPAFNVQGDSSVTGTSDERDHYRHMRAKASSYSRMQAWFWGGMVLNHLVSALDAGISAHYHNKALYQTTEGPPSEGSGWWEKVRLDSYVALGDGGSPRPTVVASLPLDW